MFILLKPTIDSHSFVSFKVYTHVDTEFSQNVWIMEIWFKVLEKSWKSSDQHVYEPWNIKILYFMLKTVKYRFYAENGKILFICPNPVKYRFYAENGKILFICQKSRKILFLCPNLVKYCFRAVFLRECV